MMFNDFPEPAYLSRANSTVQWTNMTDTLENYKPVNARGPNLYSPESFSYTYNSYGFRCDEFDMLGDKSIVFLGCSMTEGEGLPLNEVWAYILLNKIKQCTSLNIPYWNLALTARNIDTSATYLYWFAKHRPIDYIYIFVPTWYRRDFKFGSSETKFWGPSFSFTKNTAGEFSRLFSDQYYAEHQSIKSLTIIDLIRRLKGAKVMITNWSKDPADSNFVSTHFSELQFASNNIVGKDFARDSRHPGPTWHREMADFMWSQTQSWYF